MTRRPTAKDGACLGIFQAYALGGAVATIIMFATDHYFFAGELMLGTGIGWYGWLKHFGLRWTV